MNVDLQGQRFRIPGATASEIEQNCTELVIICGLKIFVAFTLQSVENFVIEKRQSINTFAVVVLERKFHCKEQSSFKVLSYRN